MINSYQNLFNKNLCFILLEGFCFRLRKNRFEIFHTFNNIVLRVARLTTLNEMGSIKKTTHYLKPSSF